MAGDHCRPPPLVACLMRASLGGLKQPTCRRQLPGAPSRKHVYSPVGAHFQCEPPASDRCWWPVAATARGTSEEAGATFSRRMVRELHKLLAVVLKPLRRSPLLRTQDHAEHTTREFGFTTLPNFWGICSFFCLRQPITALHLA